MATPPRGLALAWLAMASIWTDAFSSESPDTFRPYGNTAVLYDDNVFRFEDEEEALAQQGSTRRSDSIRTLGAGVDVDIPISRQRLLLRGNIDRNDYQHFSELDHTAGKALAEWQWRVGKQWDGRLRGNYTRKLASFTEQRIRTKDMITKREAEASAAYLWHPHWQAVASGGWMESDHAAQRRARLERTRVYGELGLDYVSRAGNRAGIWTRLMETEFPNRELVAGTPLPVDNSYEGTTVGAAVRWQLTGHSLLTGSLGYEQREYDMIGARDFDGVTGRLSWDWQVTGKTALQFSAWRDLDGIQDDVATHVDETGVSAGLVWSATAKVTVNVEAAYQKRDHAGDPGLVISDLATREDDVNMTSLMLEYAALRNVKAVLGGGVGKRDTNRPGLDYDFWELGATLEVSF